jgi:integrase
MDICGAHAFRRFRTTYLRKPRAPEGPVQFWLGHAGKSITGGYGRSLWQRRYGGEKSIIGRGYPWMA